MATLMLVLGAMVSNACLQHVQKPLSKYLREFAFARGCFARGSSRLSIVYSIA